MTRKLSTQISKAILVEWRKRNAQAPFISTPIILISSIHGDKPGLTINLVPEIPLKDVLSFLKAAAEQVEARIKEVPSVQEN